jgi:hypothetical protein
MKRSPSSSRKPHGPAADSPAVPERRAFLGGLTTAAAAASLVGLEPIVAPGTTPPAQAAGKPAGPAPAGMLRRNAAYKIRQDAAVFQMQTPVPGHPANGDEDLYPNRIASYSKGLPHNALGEVDPNAYRSLLTALSTGDPADFENIPMGSNPASRMRLVNPQAGLAFVLEGTDSHQLAIPPAPAFSSAWEAGEIVENYWMALLRDVSFLDYASDPLAAAACADLSQLSDFRGPTAGGQVTPQTLFRDPLPGTLLGPYVSQFFYQPTPFGAETVDRKMKTPLGGVDFLTSHADWLAVQNGNLPAPAQFDPVHRYIRNGRDLSEWVHIDVLFQGYFNAMLILLAMGCPPNPSNPYRTSQTQDGFGSFGGPHFAASTAQVATTALKTVWFQKWFVHRRLRPEVFAGRVHFRATGAAGYPIHADALNSQALAATFSKFGTGFLPMAFPEGSPLHPAYGAGHATVAGACVTMLKALFDESFVIPNPLVPDAAGTSLVPYTGSDAGQLTVGGELNKIASNVATGRNLAGVHWRTDGIESLRLGEAIAISILRDQRATFNEDFSGFTFTRFDGTITTV